MLMVLFAAVAAMVAICFSTIAEFYTMEAVLPDFLSDSSVSVEINQVSDSPNPVRTKDLVEYFSLHGSGVLIYKDYPISNGKAVLLSGKTNFNPDIVEGRSFQQEDFVQQEPVALIAEEFRNRCVDRDGESYFLHENIEYRVVGIFKTQASRKYAAWGDTSGAMYYVNMSALVGNNLEIPLNGSFAIDAIEKSMDVYDDFVLYANQINPDLNLRAEINMSSTSQNLMQSIKNTFIVIFALALTAFLVFLNVFSTTYYWLEGRFKELAVRIMSGGTMFRIRCLLLRDYLLIVTIGYFLGLIIAIMVIKSGVFPFIGETVHLAAISASYLLCFITGATAGWLVLLFRLKKEIAAQIRG